MTGKQTIRALIVDDEALARRFLKELLSKHPEVEVLAECTNGFEAVKAVRELGPDLLFLDIQMPKLNGFEVLELLEDRPAVIFVTAYEQYALKAFEVHAVDYLLKPFSAARLAEALAQLPRVLEHAMPPAHELAAAARPPSEHQDRVVVKDGANVAVIPVDKLDYAQAQVDYVEIHSGADSWLKHQTLTSLAESLDPQRFVRIHRSTLVNLDRIARVEPYSKDSRVAVLHDGTELQISRSGYKRLKLLLETK